MFRQTEFAGILTLLVRLEVCSERRLGGELEHFAPYLLGESPDNQLRVVANRRGMRCRIACSRAGTASRRVSGFRTDRGFETRSYMRSSSSAPTTRSYDVRQSAPTRVRELAPTSVRRSHRQGQRSHRQASASSHRQGSGVAPTSVRIAPTSVRIAPTSVRESHRQESRSHVCSVCDRRGPLRRRPIWQLDRERAAR